MDPCFVYKLNVRYLCKLMHYHPHPPYTFNEFHVIIKTIMIPIFVHTKPKQLLHLKCFSEGVFIAKVIKFNKLLVKYNNIFVKNEK
jgi:hypothetical protein